MKNKLEIFSLFVCFQLLITRQINNNATWRKRPSQNVGVSVYAKYLQPAVTTKPQSSLPNTQIFSSKAETEAQLPNQSQKLQFR